MDMLCFDAVHRYGAVELDEMPFQPSPNDDSNDQKTRLDDLLRPSFFVFRKIPTAAES